MTGAIDKPPRFEDIALPSDVEAFRALGLDEIGYIRPHRINDQIAWVLHAADGTTVTVQRDPSSALHAAYANDLILATVH